MMRWEHEMVYEDDIMAPSLMDFCDVSRVPQIIGCQAWQNGKTCCMHGGSLKCHLSVRNPASKDRHVTPNPVQCNPMQPHLHHT